MTYLTDINEAFYNLARFKLRSILAIIGVLVGTASVVILLTGGELAARETLKQFTSLGTQLVSVTFQNKGNDATKQTTVETLFNFKKNQPTIEKLAPYAHFAVPIHNQTETYPSVLLGVTADFSAINQLQAQQGRLITFADHHHTYCVLGWHVFQQWKHLLSSHPIGKTLLIDKQIYTIVGIAAPWPENQFVIANINDAVMIPIEAAIRLHPAQVQHMLIETKPNTDLLVLQQKVSQWLHEAGISDHPEFRSAKELIDKMERQNTILTTFLGMIGSVALLAGGIGIMNMMLISINLRRREIGIRLAVGATPRDIGRLFLIEAMILAALGGVLGSVVGVVIVFVLTQCFHWSFAIVWQPIVIGLFVSVLTGIFFGVYPAVRAANLEPMVALRSN